MKHHLFTLLMALAASGASAQNTIWFDQPTSLKGRACWYGGHPERFDAQHKPVRAGDAAVNSDHEWEYRSLPLGNGSIGCNVMGSISTERYTLNEKTLWRGGPNTAKGAADYWNQNKQSAHVLKDIRQAFTDEDWNKAAQLTAQNFNSPVPYEATGEPQFRFGSFTTMGELCIDTEIDEQGVSNYRRALSVDSAYADVRFTAADGTTYERRTFISYPANVMAIRFRASKPCKQNLAIDYTPSPVGEAISRATTLSGIDYVGELDNNHMKYAVRLRVLPKGGEMSVDGHKVCVKGADEVVILLTADTDYAPNYNPDFNDPKAYVGVNPELTTTQWMKKASKKSFNKLFNEHYKDSTTV